MKDRGYTKKSGENLIQVQGRDTQTGKALLPHKCMIRTQSIQSTHHKELISLGKIFSSDFSNWWESIKLGLDGLHLTNKFRNSHALLTKVD